LFELAIYDPASGLNPVSLVSRPLSMPFGLFHPPHGRRSMVAEL
jgi:hypothetical protein